MYKTALASAKATAKRVCIFRCKDIINQDSNWLHIHVVKNSTYGIWPENFWCFKYYFFANNLNFRIFRDKVRDQPMIVYIIKDTLHMISYIYNSLAPRYSHSHDLVIYISMLFDKNGRFQQRKWFVPFHYCTSVSH